MSKEIKKKFKCKVCKDKYPITVNMLRDVFHMTGFGDRQFSKAFNCPTCGTIYNNWGLNSKFKHVPYEFIDA